MKICTRFLLIPLCMATAWILFTVLSLSTEWSRLMQCIFWDLFTLHLPPLPHSFSLLYISGLDSYNRYYEEATRQHCSRTRTGKSVDDPDCSIHRIRVTPPPPENDPLFHPFLSFSANFRTSFIDPFGSEGLSKVQS
jgi:hypothetical protein